MSRIVFIAPPLMGHVIPNHLMAQQLSRKKQEVFFIHFFEAYPFAVSYELCYVPNTFKKTISDFQVDYNRIYDLVQPYAIFFKSVFEEVKKIVQQINPDMLVIDHFFPVGELPAKELDIPYIFTYSSPDPFVADVATEPEVAKLNHIIRKKGVDLYRDHMKSVFGIPVNLFPFSSVQNICFASPSVVNNEHLDTEKTKFFSIYDNASYPISFAGPAIYEKDAGVEDSALRILISGSPGKKIFISFGTVWMKLINMKDAYSKMMPVLRNIVLSFNQPGNILLYSGDREMFTEAIKGLALDCIVVSKESVNQYYLLKEFDLIFFHGGYNTFAEAVISKVPMICIPMGWDQGKIARIILEKRLGERISFLHNSPEEIAEKADRIINNEIIKESISRMAEDFLSRDGGVNGAEVVINAIEKGRKK